MGTLGTFFFYLHKDKKAVGPHKETCEAYGVDCLTYVSEVVKTFSFWIFLIVR